MLIFHVIIAVISILSATFARIKPSRLALNLNYVLSAGCITSGIVLGFEAPKSIGQLCVSGVVYIAFMTINYQKIKHQLSANS